MDSNLIHFLDKQASDWSRDHMLSPEDADAAEGLAGQLVICHVHPRNLYFPPIESRKVEMMVVLKGHVTQLINRQEVYLQQGDLLLCNLYTEHGVLPLGRDDLAVNLSIAPDFFNQTESPIHGRTIVTSLLAELLSQKKSEGQYLHFCAGGHLPIHHLIEIILSHFYQQHEPQTKWSETDDKQMIGIALSMILFYLSKDLTHLATDTPMNYDQITIQTLRRYLATSYENANLKELAYNLNCSESSLSRNIKRLTGLSFTELVQQRRFEQAQRLLRETEMPIADISTAIGYENVSYFYHLFAQRFGMTPKQYRESAAPEREAGATG